MAEAVKAAIRSGNYAKALQEAQNYELHHAAFNADDTQVPKMLTVQLLLYLIENDLTNARFLWKRVPKESRSKEFSAVWKIGRAMWKNDYAAVYESVQFSWAGDTAALVAVLTEKFRARTFDLVARAYTVISVENAKVLLGQQKEDLLKSAEAAGWEVDGDYLKPKVAESSSNKETNLKQLNQLTDYVVFLERKN